MDYQGVTSRNRLSDRDMLLDLLITEKHLSELYDQGVLEAASPMLANTFERLQADTHDNARIIFNAMQARTWYNPEQGSRTERMPKQRKPITQTFDVAADSKYAVTSGSRGFGRRLANGQRFGKSGVYSSKNTETYSREWQ